MSRKLTPELLNHWLKDALKRVRKGADEEQLFLEQGYVKFPALAKLMLRILRERGFDWILCDDYLGPIEAILNSQSVLMRKIGKRSLYKVKGKRRTIPIRWSLNSSAKPPKKRKMKR